ncbi:unnamed protein product, partial [Choristocarpus tenellus]
MQSTDASADNEVCAILSSPVQKYVVKPQARPGGVGDTGRLGPPSPRANGSHGHLGILGVGSSGVIVGSTVTKPSGSSGGRGVGRAPSLVRPPGAPSPPRSPVLPSASGGTWDPQDQRSAFSVPVGRVGRLNGCHDQGREENGDRAPIAATSAFGSVDLGGFRVVRGDGLEDDAVIKGQGGKGVPNTQDGIVRVGGGRTPGPARKQPLVSSDHQGLGQEQGMGPGGAGGGLRRPDPSQQLVLDGRPGEDYGYSSFRSGGLVQQGDLGVGGGLEVSGVTVSSESLPSTCPNPSSHVLTTLSSSSSTLVDGTRTLPAASTGEDLEGGGHADGSADWGIMRYGLTLATPVSVQVEGRGREYGPSGQQGQPVSSAEDSSTVASMLDSLSLSDITAQAGGAGRMGTAGLGKGQAHGREVEHGVPNFGFLNSGGLPQYRLADVQSQLLPKAHDVAPQPQQSKSYVPLQRKHHPLEFAPRPGAARLSGVAAGGSDPDAGYVHRHRSSREQQGQGLGCAEGDVSSQAGLMAGTGLGAGSLRWHHPQRGSSLGPGLEPSGAVSGTGGRGVDAGLEGRGISSGSGEQIRRHGGHQGNDQGQDLGQGVREVAPSLEAHEDSQLCHQQQSSLRQQ